MTNIFDNTHNYFKNHTINTAGGDYAEGNIDKRTGSFVTNLHADHVYVNPTPITFERESLLDTIHQASAELHSYTGEIAGHHIEREEVTEIIDWVLHGEPHERLGMLLNQAGGGKTVIMRDVLVQLEHRGIPVLAIKADGLSGITTPNDLIAHLHLPASVDTCIRFLADEGQVVVLLDQLDALSLVLTRDQRALGVLLETLARLRTINNVRVIASCRTFDLNNDPRLSQIAAYRSFRLNPLAADQISLVLQSLGIQYSHLLPDHQSLLQVPLHLSLYARVVDGAAAGKPPEAFRSLQELYEALWNRCILSIPPEQPTSKERKDAMYALVDAMQARSQTNAPLAVLDEYPEASRYLEREGFIRQEHGNWLFSHQTLLDYCYARRFVSKNIPLSREILNSTQGLFERSQLVQVLAYLRGSDPITYRREIAALLFADGLRVHLRLLTIGWFGSLQHPRNDEFQLALRLLDHPTAYAHFLQAISSNVAWFDLLKERTILQMRRSDDLTRLNAVISYLGNIIQLRPDDVLMLIRPYLGISEAWDGRIAFCLNQIKDWRNDIALDMLCDLLHRGRGGDRALWCLDEMAASNPGGGCRALAAYLGYHLSMLLAQESEAGAPDIVNRFMWHRELLEVHGMQEIMQQALQHCPEYIIMHLLPWFIRAVADMTGPHESAECYPSDSLFASRWYDSQRPRGGPAFVRQLISALNHKAQTDQAAFRSLASNLAKHEKLAIHRVLVQAYLGDPEEYADDIFDYLTADLRRLCIGEPIENPWYESCCLYGAVFCYVSVERRLQLEQLILKLFPRWEYKLQGSLGSTQLRFLKSADPELLTPLARRRLQEWERKFPEYTLDPPRGIFAKWLGPPINQREQEKMSDEAWLNAMRKYTADSSHRLMVGGVVELARAFREHVKNHTERFYHLALQFDGSISEYYAEGAITGLADSTAPAIQVFDLIRRLHQFINHQQREICWALSKRAQDQVPDDLLDLITTWAVSDPDPDTLSLLTGDLYNAGINSNRGAAVEAMCHCASQRTPPQYERIFQVLEQAACDPSLAVRACVIEGLSALLKVDEIRTLAIFEQTISGSENLLRSQPTHHFLYWTYRRHFARIRPWIERMLVHTDSATRQHGAELACLAAFSYQEATTLAEQAMHGDDFNRRGAAIVYAHNLAEIDTESICRDYLLRLMDDPDKQVRSYIGNCFEHLNLAHFPRVQSFIGTFLESPALLDGARQLIKYLTLLAVDHHEIVLRATQRILDIIGSSMVDTSTSYAGLERELVRLPLAVYNSTNDPETKSEAMALFECLLLLGSWSAHAALTDWDRR